MTPALRCPVCRGEISEEAGSLRCRSCGRVYAVEDGIPRMLDPSLPGIEAKLREVDGWPAMARAQGWYEPDDDVDRVLPYVCRDLGWDDPVWRANEHSFDLLLDRYLHPGMRVLEVGAAKCWAAPHVLGRGAEYVATDIVADPNVGLGRGAFFERQAGRPFLRVQADGERLPFADGAFDLVFCVAALHHALDLSGMTRELARVARRGGIVAALNEGTRALGRGAEFEGQDEEKRYGINEHVHTMWAYLGAFGRARLLPLRVEHAEGPETLRSRRIGGRLLRLPGGRFWAMLLAQNFYGYSGVSIFARKIY